MHSLSWLMISSGMKIYPLSTGDNNNNALPSGYLCYSELERSTMLLIGKPSISMGHGFHGYVK